jgi:hypothetical protein
MEGPLHERGLSADPAKTGSENARSDTGGKQ